MFRLNHFGLSQRLWDGVWLLVLSFYVMAGISITTFHADESLHIYTSRDYATLFMHRKPGDLTTQPPYSELDPDSHLRITTGSVTRYATGLAGHIGGLHERDLPGLWLWHLDYETNLQQGNRPSDVMLRAGRVPSALFLSLSVIVIFALGWQFGGRLLA
ncbi:MAG: hypothetical protein GY767_12145, partial [Shimia sp.]|nr:hypothetical protein [Shimia sp.]